MKYFLILLATLFIIPQALAVEKAQVLIIVEEIGSYTECVDPENCTAQELIDQAAWQARKDNFLGLKAKLMRSEGWLVDGTWDDIINEEKGVTVTKAGQTGRAFWFPMNRIEKPSPTDWVDAKIPVVKENWDFKAWTTDNAQQELVDRGYTIVTGE